MRKLFVIFCFPIIILFLAIACNKEEELWFESLVVYTDAVSEISASGALFAAKAINYDELDILDYGFVWGTNQEPLLNESEIISLGSSLSSSTFKAELTVELRPSTDYFVCAFIQTKDFIFYGKVQKFQNNVSYWNLIDQLPLRSFKSGVYRVYGCVINDKGYISLDHYKDSSIDYSSLNYIYESGYKLRNWSLNNRISFNNHSSSFMYAYQNSIYFKDQYEFWKYTPPSDPVEINYYYYNYSYSYVGFKNKLFLFGRYYNMDCFDISTNSGQNMAATPVQIVRNGVVVNEIIYVFTNENEIWQYDPNNETWELNVLIPTNIEVDKFTPIMVFQEYIYIAINDHIYKYSPSAHQWFISINLTPNFTNSNFLFELDNLIYINSNENIFEYNPNMDIFTELNL